MERKLGALISPKDLRDYKTDMKEVLAGIPKEVSIPEELTIPSNIRVKDQGLVNSCVAHSLSSALEANDTHEEDNNFSTRLDLPVIDQLGYYQRRRNVYERSFKNYKKSRCSKK